MEPVDQNRPFDREADLEALLRQADPPLADAGFSARVLAALPAPARRSRSRVWWCLAGAVTGTAVAAAGGISWASLAESSAQVGRQLAELATVAADPSVALAFVLIVYALVYVFRRDQFGPDVH